MKMKLQNTLLASAVILLAVIPLFLAQPAGEGAEIFSGADGQAEVLIGEIYPDYEPWFSSLWEPPSGEIESLLFSLQAAIGAGVLGFALGQFRGRKMNCRP